jgi:hypothetical protein
LLATLTGMSGELDRVITQGAAQAQLRLDDGQFALRSFQPARPR